MCDGWLARIAARAATTASGIQVDDLRCCLLGAGHISGRWRAWEYGRSAKGVKDDYAYSGWLPAWPGIVEGGAKWCNMTPVTSKRGLDCNPSIWHWIYPTRRIACLALDRESPLTRPVHRQHPRHAQAQAVSDTGLCSCPTRRLLTHERMGGTKDQRKGLGMACQVRTPRRKICA